MIVVFEFMDGTSVEYDVAEFKQAMEMRHSQFKGVPWTIKDVRGLKRNEALDKRCTRCNLSIKENDNVSIKSDGVCSRCVTNDLNRMPFIKQSRRP